MTLDDHEIHRVTEDLWQTMFSLDVRHLDHEAPRSPKDGVLTGCVHVSGAWEGAAMLSCSTELARHVAGIMFGASELSDNEICDAIGELTNITAGQIQPLLPSPSELSLPSVVEGHDYRLNIPRSVLLTRVFFECQGKPLSITVVQQTQHEREKSG